MTAPLVSSADDALYLRLAARCALRAQGRAEPNPLVGCVLVRDGRVIGIGHHRRFGAAHAEVEAITNARARGERIDGATAYVTLEPCNSWGRNPPCSDALVAAKVREVVYAVTDPNPMKAGGALRLREAGIIARQSTASPLATAISQPFIKRVTTGLPWVIAKWAQTIDGRVATRTGESKWISGVWARQRVHQLRGRVDAILTGIGTVVADDPLLNARLPRSPRRVAKRVIADTGLEIPLDSQLVRTARELPTLVACERSMASGTYTAKKRAALDQAGVEIIPIADQGIGGGLNLRELLTALARDHHVATVMIESGPGLLGSLFESDLVDEAVVYIAPMLLADEQARSAAVGRVAEKLSNARQFQLCRVKALDGDVEITYRRVREQTV
ncbi:MAG TPA: bifunctional diaminohydroxyphosphoribosylaminopyrimidine deaminase/5-amino-6-(5-phosphoribosylamino)uracil reductase RibD [Phycisphaerales bacterium]|nr:bifunctional diaminohydroxyphosphoribosylaminopyrimidine deaminase/5-amino-6-(5-phosphoribosylamino)uracil reductase RibD [Phycisphaerales bacterium]